MADRNRAFLGAGWKFPLELDARGRIALVYEEDDVVEAVRMILLTQKGERQMRPEFGSELHRLQFAPANATTCGLASRYAQEALTRWEPRIESVNARTWVDPDEPSRLLIDVHYILRTDNSERNLVFPFYVIPGEK
jgi:uncharacterized protein